MTYRLSFYQRTKEVELKDTAPKGRDTQQIHVSLRAISKNLWQESRFVFILFYVILLVMPFFSVSLCMTILSEYIV